MYMYVCMYIFMYVCRHIHTNIHTYLQCCNLFLKTSKRSMRPLHDSLFTTPAYICVMCVYACICM